MIRPLRRRHRWIMPVLLVLLAIAAALALTHPAPSPRVDVLPQELAR
jgi:hypothetical protein